jgi:L-ascorbate metabolism protein UlaG (beta-lactamase superfamily)
MNITQIRNATQLITYAGKRFLVDPMLAPKGAYPGFPGTAHADIRNPTVDLPVEVTTLLDADAVIVTHTHDDHWDQTAIAQIAKDKPIYVQNDSDAALLRSQILPEAGNMPIERVAELVGFNSAVTWRQQFKARFGVSPAEWRRTFRTHS